MSGAEPDQSLTDGGKQSLKHFFSASLARYYCSSSSWANHHVKVHIWNIFVMEKRYKRISEHINVKINRTNIKQTNIPTANAANFRIFSNIPHTLRAWYYSNWTGNVRELGCCAGLSSGESCDGRSGFDLAISAFTTIGKSRLFHHGWHWWWHRLKFSRLYDDIDYNAQGIDNVIWVDHIVVDIAASRTHFACAASLFDSRSGFLHLHIW